MQHHTFDPARFLVAQEAVYSNVLRELRDGSKVSHWMWFIFPQISGLGSSPMSERFAIADADEARAFANHEVLGARLQECVSIVNALQGKTAHEIFDSPDDLKFCASMTLFSTAEPGRELFKEALAKYFGGKPDSLTLAKLGRL